MLAGFAEVEFTPKKGNIPGSFLPREAEGTLGGVFSNAAAFTNGEDSVILVSMDILSFHAEYANDMRQRISDATGVPASNVLIAATHTHSSAPLEYQLWMCPPDLEISANTANKTVEAAICAWNNRCEAKLGVGRGYEWRYSFCRDWHMRNGTIQMNPGGRPAEDLICPTSNVDHSVNVMRIDDANGKVKCFIVNYANHAATDGPEDVFSADYPGFMRRKLKEMYGQDVIVLFFNGAAGDVNCFDFKYNAHNEYGGEGKVIGEALAMDVAEINKRIHADVTTPCIQSISKIHQTARRFKTKEDYEWALNLLEKAKNGENVSGFDLAFATEYAEDDSNVPKHVDIEIHTIQLGPWAIVGLPSEIFSEIGLKIKANSPYNNTLVFELANGTHGYISPDRIIRSEAYEARFSKYNAYTGIGTADVLINGSVAQLNEMAEKQTY